MKRLILILSLVCLTISGWAEQISREQALRQAQSFFSKKGISRTLISAETQLSRHRAQGSMQTDCYYVFNAGQNEGFVIISGDDRTEAVLGYAEQGSFDVDNIPPAMAELLNHYAEQIEAIRNGAAVNRSSEYYSKVENLMKVNWNQRGPYYGKTPLGYYTNSNEGVHCVTGCVPTAMAQVLYHQHFVDATQARILGYTNYYYWTPPSGKKYGYLEDVPAGTALEWDKMVDNYETQETTSVQQDAVANLMVYCGTALNTKYGIDASTASVSDIPDALKTYFGYSLATCYVSQSRYTDTEWDKLIYKEIVSGRPVIYGGYTSNDAGHAFIVHGYDGEGKYAINWGWGGQSDGYFTLKNLTPPTQGAGGKSGGYNYKHEAVIHLAKYDGPFTETVKATVTGIKIGYDKNNKGELVTPTKTEYTANKDQWGRVPFSLAVSFTSILANTYTMDFGYGIQNTSGQIIRDVQLMNTQDIKYGKEWTFTRWMTAFGGDLSVGTYYIKAYSKQKDAAIWLECDDINKYAVRIDVTSSAMSFKVVDVSSETPDPGPEVTDADRTELAATYSSLMSKVEKKQAEVEANSKLMEVLTLSIAEKRDAAAVVEAESASINTKLASDTYLSESEKNEFENQLASLNSQKAQQNNDLAKIASELASIETENAALKMQITNLLSQIVDLLGAVTGITTTEGLFASMASATKMATTIDEIDVSCVSIQLSATYNSLLAISYNSLQTDLSELDQKVDQMIAAKKAEVLTKAKEACQSAVDQLDETINDHQEKYALLQKAYEDMLAVMNEFDVMIASMKQQQADITKTLEELIAKQTSTDYSEKIDTLQENLKKLTDNMDLIDSQYAQMSTMIMQLEDHLEQYDILIKSATSTHDSIQIYLPSVAEPGDVDTMTSIATKAANLLSSDGVSTYNLFIGNYKIVLDDLSFLLENIKIVLAQANTLQTDVEYEATSIQRVTIDESEVSGRYDMKGNRVDSTYKGVQIIRLKNGRTIKINVK